MTDARRLADLFGDDPQKVGVVDGTEDDFGDLVHEAALALGLDPDSMSGSEWDHFQDVAATCSATNMAEWLAHLRFQGTP